MLNFDSAFAALPLVAILRGLVPEDAEAIGGALVDAGFTLIEVPLNSPNPFASIEQLTRRFADRAMIGAGTMMAQDDVRRLVDAGGHLAVSPHFDPELQRAAEAAGLVTIPGVATPSEAFAALRAGASALKAFPAEMIPPAVLKSWRSVIPTSVAILPVGGVTTENMGAYVAAGASGFGIGSALFKPGIDAAAIGAKAKAFVAAWRAAQA